MTPNDFVRLEDKVDGLTTAVAKIVLFEERQSVQAKAIEAIASRTESTEKRLDMWINRGVGVWAFAAAAGAAYKIAFH